MPKTSFLELETFKFWLQPWFFEPEMVPAFYPKYAVLQRQISRWVKSVDLTASKKQSWSQNFINPSPPQAEWPHHLPTWTQGCHDISSLIVVEAEDALDDNVPDHVFEPSRIGAKASYHIQYG